LMSFAQYFLSAAVTIYGPRSDPPMPMLTMLVSFLPVAPLNAPLRTASENSFIFACTRRISGITSTPSTVTGLPEKLRSAVCSTARFSVTLIFLPVNISSIRSFKLCSRARLNSASSTPASKRFLE